MSNDSACVVIPARFHSTRFPGKPLVKLLDRPMIVWVSELAAKAVGKENVYVATDDRRIMDCLQEFGYQTVATSPEALTGTDRVAEAADKIEEYQLIINVQGDEPLVQPEDIKRCIALKKLFPAHVVNGYTSLNIDESPENKNLPKMVMNEDEELIYASRAPIPSGKSERLPNSYNKQVCIYGFNKEELSQFRKLGRKSVTESMEDIEILRFFELGRKIKMFRCKTGSLAVDIPEDVPLVEKALRAIWQ